MMGVLTYLAYFLAFVWLLAVYKVFILDDGREFQEKMRLRAIELELRGKELSNPSIDVPSVPKTMPFKLEEPKKSTSFKIKIGDLKKPVKVKHADSNAVLMWPPVLKDGTLSPADGFDEMPLIDLQVPKFWSPPEGTDLNTVGKLVNGHETIFLMIASFRDFQCKETIASAFSRAKYPERLFIAAVDQTVPGDGMCLDLEIPCSQDNTQPACVYRDQISVFNMDAKEATGPVTARHIGDRMYRGEYFAMQLDAHCVFTTDWDVHIVDQWKSTKNEMAVLSSYLSDVQGSVSPEGMSLRKTRPIMCNSDYEGNMPIRYLRHGSQPEDYAAIRDMPQLQPYWAAGFSFSRGHFKIRVPYDAYQPMVFQGEEIAIGIRGFTWGYDFYAPRDSVVFHEYASMSGRRKAVPFFTNGNKHSGEGPKSLRRGMAIVGLSPDLEPDSWDHREMEKYGLGKERDLALFYKLFLIKPLERKATPICPFVTTGIMHRQFTPFLRENRLGIDYSHLLDYDTKAHFKPRQPN